MRGSTRTRRHPQKKNRPKKVDEQNDKETITGRSSSSSSSSSSDEDESLKQSEHIALISLITAERAVLKALQMLDEGAV